MSVVGEHALGQFRDRIDVGEVAGVRLGVTPRGPDLVPDLGEQFGSASHEQDGRARGAESQSARLADAGRRPSDEYDLAGRGPAQAAI